MTLTANITEGSYEFLGRPLPELEIHIEDSAAGPGTLSFLFDSSSGNLALNIQNTQQGQSSVTLPFAEAEIFLLRALKLLEQEKANAQS